jgi:hypothetical protein
MSQEDNLKTFWNCGWNSWQLLELKLNTMLFRNEKNILLNTVRSEFKISADDSGFTYSWGKPLFIYLFICKSYQYCAVYCRIVGW